MSENVPDERIVFTAESPQLAEAVVRLLAANDIPAEIATDGPQTKSDPLTGAAEMERTEAFPVAVTDPGKLKDARELLASKQTADAVKEIRDRRASRTGTVSATCEDCGKSSEWPAQKLGTTELCPYCGGYMDIPDPDDDWSDVDFGEAEDENENGEEGQ